MIQLDLTPEEQETLSAILENAISDLRMEISHTDRLDFRTGLKRKKAVLNKLLSATNETHPTV